MVELDELEWRVQECHIQENVALIKTELSKIRIAVSSPIEVYLPQAWLVSGHAYSSWPCNTREEPQWKELARQETMWERLHERECSLPYDFASFDHQPTTAEVMAFQQATNGCARRLIQSHQQSDIEDLTANLLTGFQQATLTSPPGLGAQHTFRVTGGLMPGLRSTSCVGSGWNAIFGQFSTKLRLRTRCSSTTRRFFFRKATSPLCLHCGELGNTEHALLRCNQYHKERATLLQSNTT